MRTIEMKPHETNGLLITFCGLDGCGKSTMIRRLKQYLESVSLPVTVTKQPTDMMRKTDIFRVYMDDPDHSKYEYRALSLMAAADRIQHVNQVILPALREGKIMICDRYFYSCLANLRARGYVRDRWIYEIAKEIPQPELAFFLDVPVETAVRRVRSRPEEKDRYIDMDLQYRLREEYRCIGHKSKGILLSTMDSEEETFEQIKRSVEKSLNKKKIERKEENNGKK